MTIKDTFGEIATKMIKNIRYPAAPNPDYVYQPAVKENRAYIEKILDQLVDPNSIIGQAENLDKLWNLCRQGKSCLILMEHYSNFDLPCLYYMVERHHPEMSSALDSILSIAGMKLSLESSFVQSCTEAYSRIVIYPSRSLMAIEDPEVYKREAQLSMAVNRAALHEMVRRKHQGHIILLFPAGTRYRPGHPDTKRGVKEVTSYLKQFDYFMPISIAGNVLRINPDATMSDDIPHHDTMVFDFGEIQSCASFIAQEKAKSHHDSDPKQVIADGVMDLLETMHSESDRKRRKLLEKN